MYGVSSRAWQMDEVLTEATYTHLCLAMCIPRGLWTLALAQACQQALKHSATEFTKYAFWEE